MNKTTASILEDYFERAQNSEPNNNALGGWGLIFGGSQDPVSISKSLIKLEDLISRFSRDMEAANVDARKYTVYVQKMRDMVSGNLTTPTAAWSGTKTSISVDIINYLNLAHHILESKGLFCSLDENEIRDCIETIDSLLSEIKSSNIDIAVKNALISKILGLKDAIQDYLHFGKNEIFKEGINVAVLNKMYEGLLLEESNRGIREKLESALKKAHSIMKTSNDVSKFVENAIKVAPYLIQMMN